MKRFAIDAEVDVLVQRVEAVPCPAAADVVALAWHYRQRDTARALDYVRLAARLRSDAGVPDDDGASRLLLVRAEAAWLFGSLAEAQALVDEASCRFAAAQCDAGRADAAWLAASIASDAGDFPLRRREMGRACALATAAGDAERRDAARLATWFFEAADDPAKALAERGEAVAAFLAPAGACAPVDGLAALAHAFFFHALSATSGRLSDVVAHGHRLYEAALRSGQMRRAITAANNLANSYGDLGDLVAMIEQVDLATPLARRAGWPQMLGLCLAGNAQALIRTGRLDAAALCATEAVELLAPYPASRNYQVAICHLGNVERIRGRFDEAERHFRALLALPMAHDFGDLRAHACQGLAEALAARSGREGPRTAAARAYANAALAAALQAQDVAAAVDAHRLLARLAVDNPGERGAGSALSHLLAAVELLDASPAIVPPGDLFEELATEHARLGAHAQAFAAARRALAALRAQAETDAVNRAMLLEVRFDTARLVSEAELQKKLAEAERRRAVELERMHGEVVAAQALLTARNDELKRAYAAIQDLSVTDPLTGLWNRRFLLQNIERDVLTCIRKHETANAEGRGADGQTRDILFLLVDIDHFKAVNDTYGHGAGDRMLIQFKDRLCAVFRKPDYIVRWGGEEFLVVLHKVSRSDGPALAERLRAVVAATPFRVGADVLLHKTCSIGIAAFPPDRERPRAHSWTEVVEQADRRLYVAKQAGRNRWQAQSAFETLEAALEPPPA